MSKECRMYMTVIALPKDRKKHKLKIFREVYDICHLFGPGATEKDADKFYMVIRLLSHLEEGKAPERDYIHLNDYDVIIKWEDQKNE